MDTRIIPARAGFTGRQDRESYGGTDHPRSRGVYICESERRFRGQGSSPLARGLQIIPLGRIRARRIIPARAGFTNPRAFEKGIGRDHPRSRGVYVSNFFADIAHEGSCPLARGLLKDSLKKIPLPGIIPARAGFTLPIRLMSASRKDHPRSRGVYGDFTAGEYMDAGSSPLARGLLQEIIRAEAYRRIIPARAGFTSSAAGRGRVARDHPRSRGVYRGLEG